LIQEIAHIGLLEDEAIEIDIAALEIAALDHPGTSLRPYFDSLDEMAQDIGDVAHAADSAEQQAGILAQILAEKHRFSGDSETYDEPANADLISVLDRRRGMPIALSIVYVALARRIGWVANALNTPGHVLVSIAGDETILIDPFNDGATVDSAQLAVLLAEAVGNGVTLGPEHLSPMSNRGILVRLLMNQATRAEMTGRPDRSLIVYHRITTVAPSYAQGWWDRARLELVGERPDAARASLSAMLEMTRDPTLRDLIKARIASLGTFGTA
jgi:regulator of sirC expression with transglutaminase-like and TPR domain